jgi:hypothetical protein
MKRFLLVVVTLCWGLPAWASSGQPPANEPEDAIARVGDQTITFTQLNTLLNSAAVVGLSVPALGTPERNTVMVTMLDKAISVDLLYLDALKRGKGDDPGYREELQAFSDGILAGLYRARHLVGEVEVTAEEVNEFFEKDITPGTEMTERVRTAIEASIRKEKFKQRTADMSQRLREGIRVVARTENLEPTEDALRSDDDVIAEVGDREITWGEAKGVLTTPNNSLDLARRLNALNGLIDQDLMARKGREAGLESDAVYRKRLAEFTKTRLVNRHRAELIRDMEPSDEELGGYFEENRERIVFKERRKILMVVLESREQAEEIKRRIDSGEITIYQAAQEHSIDPRAETDLGDFGWVEKGSCFPDLDRVTFSLGPDELGGPVESPAGWHLVKVVDLRDARFTDLAEEETRAATRRLYLKQKLNEYVAGLRQNDFPVVVYGDNLKRLFHAEGQWIAAKTKEMEQQPERAQQILDEMRKVVE